MDTPLPKVLYKNKIKSDLFKVALFFGTFRWWKIFDWNFQPIWCWKSGQKWGNSCSIFTVMTCSTQLALIQITIASIAVLQRLCYPTIKNRSRQFNFYKRYSCFTVWHFCNWFNQTAVFNIESTSKMTKQPFLTLNWCWNLVSTLNWCHF